jgi:N-acetylmuramoyl-L-alanine amidase
LKILDRSHYALRLGAVLFLLLLPAAPVYARRSEAWAKSQFASAERMREALNGRPQEERTRREYQRVISAYRRVYYGAPASGKADPSVLAVAELLAEMGRCLDDSKSLRSAIGQYEFLRREYPGSRYRFDALFTIGEIYKDDLNDSTRARAVFEEFLRRYPRHHLAEEARKGLAEPVQQAALRAKDDADSDDEDDSGTTNTSKENSDKPASSAPETKSVKLPRVTGIRHWSTPDYTRVAIDLEQDIKYESQRIDHPDRIFFDLLDTKLTSTLVGKTFDVDDGFLKKIRVAQFQPGKTRVVLEVDDLSDYDAFLLSNPSRLIIDVHGKQIAKTVPAKESASKAAVKPETLKSAPTAKPEASASSLKPGPSLQAKTESGKPVQPTTVASITGPKKKVVEADDEDDKVVKLEPADVTPPSKAKIPPAGDSAERAKKTTAKGKNKAASAKLNVHEAQPTASGDRSLIRALGLKIGKIVIDPGHGGHDAGTIGPNGLEEKELVLEVARRLGKLLETRLGAEVVYTRNDDTFIPLETRTAIANQEQADLFVSIHANSSDDADARGVETYYLNFTSSRDALEVAARENAVSEKSIHELQDLVKKIALKEKIEESREFATDVQRALHSGLAGKSPGVRDRGVRKAPFIVLIGANMPSILAEISFVSNPGDARRLQTPEYRRRIAESLYRGIAKYVGGLSGVKVASKLEKGEGQ